MPGLRSATDSDFCFLMSFSHHTSVFRLSTFSVALSTLSALNQILMSMTVFWRWSTMHLQTTLPHWRPDNHDGKRCSTSTTLQCTRVRSVNAQTTTAAIGTRVPCQEVWMVPQAPAQRERHCASPRPSWSLLLSFLKWATYRSVPPLRR